jgi:hypothetical protein
MLIELATMTATSTLTQMLSDYLREQAKPSIRQVHRNA